MCGACTGELGDSCVCNDGALWYTMHEDQLVDMEEKLKISAEVQSNDGWVSETRAKDPFLTVPSLMHKNA